VEKVWSGVLDEPALEEIKQRTAGNKPAADNPGNHPALSMK
jgi:hypothetical protein